MLCDNCGKRKVEVAIRQVIKGEVETINLCRPCAEELGYLSSEPPSITISFSMRETDEVQRKKSANLKNRRDDDAYEGVVCPGCGLAFKEFRRVGLLGCQQCYESFRYPLGAKLQREQGVESHWDSSKFFSAIPVRDDAAVSEKRRLERLEEERRNSINRLKSEIDDAVAHEEYELAALLRDRLKPLQEGKSLEC